MNAWGPLPVPVHGMIFLRSGFVIVERHVGRILCNETFDNRWICGARQELPYDFCGGLNHCFVPLSFWYGRYFEGCEKRKLQFALTLTLLRSENIIESSVPRRR